VSKQLSEASENSPNITVQIAGTTAKPIFDDFAI
jgi:hypothetical protein